MLDVIKSAFSKIFNNLSNKYEKFLTIYIIINVIWIFLGMFLCNYIRYSYHAFSTSYVLFFIINTIIIILLNFLKKASFEKIDIFLILLVIFGIISTIFSKNINISLYGWWKRYEGLFQLLYYYSLLYLCSNILKDKSKKWIISFILIFGLVNVFVSILQVFDILKFIPINCRGTTLGQGFTGNSNFFGSYMLLCLGCSMGLFIFNSKRIIYNIVCLLLCLCFYIGLLLSSALSSMVGLFFVVLFIIIYFVILFVKKQINMYFVIRFIILLISFLCLNFVLGSFNKTVMNSDIRRFMSESTEVAKGNFDDSYGSARLFIWKNTLKIVPKYLVHGVGIDSFYDAFDTPLFIKYGTVIEYYDKAHNEYLQKLVCEGIFSCLTYLGMLFIIFIGSVKKIFVQKDYLTIGLFLSFIGYSVQAFFNISVIEVAPLFWIVLGLLYDKNCKFSKSCKSL